MKKDEKIEKKGVTTRVNWIFIVAAIAVLCNLLLAAGMDVSTDPTTDFNVSKGFIFNVTANISCQTGSCGNVTAALNAPVWWNTSWPYRQQVNLSVSSGTTPGDYQVKIILNQSNVGSSWNWSDECVNANSSRLRIINGSDVSLLDYWVENCSVAGQNITLWVEVDKNITTTPSAIYVYYGNKSATPLTNGSATFVFFDDFNGDLSKWTRHKTSGVYPRIENQYMVAGGGSTSSPYGHTALGTNATYTGFVDGIIEGKYFLSADAIGELGFRGSYAGNTGYKSRIDARGGQGLSHLKPPYSGWNFLPSCTASGTPPAISTWLDFRMTITGSTFTILTGSLTKTCSDSQYTAAGEISLQNHYGSFTRYDDVRVRKYASPEPTYVIGAEERLVQKEIVQTGSGSPFFTSQANPANWTTHACLGNMTAGDYCLVVWAVNSTGNYNSSWQVFVSANESVDRTESGILNITIINDTQKPVVTGPALNTSLINQSEPVHFSVSLSDNTILISGLISLKYPNGSVVNRTLSRGSGTSWYLEMSDTNMTGTYNVTHVIAQDHAGNVNDTPLSNLTFNVSASPPADFDLLSPPDTIETTNLLPNMTWEESSDTLFANYTLLLDKDSLFGSPDFTYATYAVTNTSKVVEAPVDPDSTYYWKVIAYDVFGNAKNSSSVYSYITDLTSPSVALNNPSDFGFTTSQSVTFNYTPSDMNTITNCTFYTNATGPWIANQTNSSINKSQPNFFNATLEEGATHWNVRCNDTAGNSGSAGTNYTVIVDLTGPSVHLMSPDNGTFETVTNNINFTANASDVLANVSSCELIIDNESKQVKYAITDDVAFTFTELVLNGTHTWMVNCTDQNGLEGSSDLFNLSVSVVDSDPPLITPNWPGAESFLPYENLSFNYTPGDATGINNCSLYIDDVLNMSDANITNLAFNYFNIFNLSEGKHNWSVACYDNSTEYNLGTSSARNFTVDMTDPNITLIAPSHDSFSNSSVVVFSYLPNDTNLVNCSFYANFTGAFILNETNSTPTNGVSNTFTKNLSDGTYLWNVRCFDSSGRKSFALSNYTTKVDTAPPIVLNTSRYPTSPSTYVPEGNIQFNATLNDNFGVNSVMFESNFSGSTVNSTPAQGGAVYMVNITDSAVGIYAFKWYSNDSQGNANKTQIFAHTVGKAASVVNLDINGLDSNVSVPEGALVNHSVKMVTPPNGGVNLFVNGVLVGSGSSPLTNLSYYFDPAVFNITALYNATQNYTSSYETHFLQVNDTAPPTINLSFPADNATLGSVTVTFQYNVNDSSSISNCSLLINGTINNTNTSVQKLTTQTFVVDFDDGSYSWQVNCSDAAHNRNGTDIRTFKVMETTTLNVSINLSESEYERGENVSISLSVKDSFGNPVSGNAATAVVFTNQTTTESPWWNASWPYRRLLNVTEKNNSNLTDFQANMTIDTSALVAAGKLQSDCDDLRFADVSANPIPYWIEADCNSAKTKVWIKGNFSAFSTTAVYLYYGNSSASAGTSGADVFEYFDTGSAVGSWTLVGTSGQTFSQGLPAPSYYATSVNGNYMYRDISLTTNRVLDFGVRSDGLGNLYFLVNAAGSGQHFRAETRGGNNAGVGAAASWTSWSVPSQTCSNIATNTWYNFTLLINATTARGYINDAACGGAYTFTNNGGFIGFIGDGLGAGYTTWWDNLRVRKYLPLLPGTSISSVEQSLIYFHRNTTDVYSGQDSFTVSTLNWSFGNYSVVSKVTASGFNDGSAANAFSLVPDTTPPTITLLEPGNVSVVGSTPVWFNFSVYDNSNFKAKNCTLYANFSGTFGNLSTIWDVPLSTKKNFTVGDIEDAWYSWAVRCYDEENNTNISENFTVGINTHGPVFSNPSFNLSGINQSRTVRLNVTITESFGVGSASVAVRYPNGTVRNLSLSLSGNIYTVDVDETGDLGVYNVTQLYAVDSYGKPTVETRFNLSFSVVESRPAPFDLLSPMNNSNTTTRTPTFFWQQTSDPDFQNYTLLIDTSAQFPSPDFTYVTFPVANTSFTMTGSLVYNTVYYWMVVAYDSFGNYRNSTSIYNYILWNQPPVVTLWKPLEGDNDPDGNVTFIYEVVDEDVSTCTLYANFSGVFSPNQTLPISAGMHSFVVNDLPLNLSIIWNVECNDSQGLGSFSVENRTLIITGPLAWYDNITVVSGLEVNNTPPEGGSAGGSAQVDLLGGMQLSINFSAIFSDNNGFADIAIVNGTIWHFGNTTYYADDNETNHYATNCTIANETNSSINATCQFDVWFFANNGTWTFTAYAEDEGENSSNISINFTILPLYAIDVNVTGIVYGNVSSFDITPEIGVAIINAGNSPIDVGMYGYGGILDDGLAFSCPYNNISISNQRFSAVPGTDFTLMTPLSGSSLTPSLVDLSIEKTQTSESNRTGDVYWRLEIPPEPFGLCNGSVVVSAEVDA